MIKGVHFVRKRSHHATTWYVYAWRGGPCIMRAAGAARPLLTTEAISAYNDAVRDDRHVKADTLEGLSRDWRSPDPNQRPHSPEWRKLATSTKETWGRELDLIEKKWGSTPLALWNDARIVAKIVEWRDSRAATPRSADIGVTVLSELLKFGRLRARVRINAADGIPAIYEAADRAEIIWLPEDMAAFARVATTQVMDGLRLAALTGLRRADLVDLRWSEIGDAAIVRVAQKKTRGRRRRAVVPLIPETVELLAELRTRVRIPGVETVLVNGLGRAWPPASFTRAFNVARDKANEGAGIVQPGNARLDTGDRKKHLHDLRGTFVTKLCRVNLTDQEIASIVAWSPENVSRIRRTYVDDAAVVVAMSERIRRAVYTAL